MKTARTMVSAPTVIMTIASVLFFSSGKKSSVIRARK